MKGPKLAYFLFSEEQLSQKHTPIFISLNKKVIAVVFAVSLLFTGLWTLLSLSLDQKAEKEHQQSDINYIREALLPGIANSVWNLDLEQTRLQALGILANPNIIGVRIIEENPEEPPVLDLKKDGKFDRVSEIRFDLVANPVDRVAKFGTLILYITQDRAAARWRTEVIKNFASQGLQVLVLSFLIFYVFRSLVIRRLTQISLYFRRNPYISRFTPHFKAEREKYVCDEIDDLVAAINRTVDESKARQSEIEKLKDKAEKANQAKSFFLASINHELRTPLNAILGVSDVLDSTPIDSPERRQMLELQRRSSRHLLHLVDEILDFTKIEAGEMKIVKRPVDLRNTLITSQLILENSVTSRLNKLEVEIAPNFPQLIVEDEDRINQIFINLVSNANKFTERGLIQVRISTLADDKYEMCVSDTGCGIPKDKISEIFIPFRQLDRSTGKIREGTGIGLSLVKRLTNLMGGDIVVESTVGKGSVFRVQLPLKPAEQERKVSIVPEVNSTDVSGENIKVLVAEDTVDIQTLLKFYLSGTNIDLSFAQDGKECVSWFQKEKFSMIFMDLQMPNMNGFEATKIIRQIEQNAGISRTPIVAMTALTTKNDLEMPLHSRCDTYVSKPISKARLIEIVKTMRVANCS